MWRFLNAEICLSPMNALLRKLRSQLAKNFAARHLLTNAQGYQSSETCFYTSILWNTRLDSSLKSGFEQVHLARRFGASNLVKTPFCGNFGYDLEVMPHIISRCYISGQSILSQSR